MYKTPDKVQKYFDENPYAMRLLIIKDKYKDILSIFDYINTIKCLSSSDADQIDFCLRNFLITLEDISCSLEDIQSRYVLFDYVTDFKRIVNN